MQTAGSLELLFNIGCRTFSLRLGAAHKTGDIVGRGASTQDTVRPTTRPLLRCLAMQANIGESQRSRGRYACQVNFDHRQLLCAAGCSYEAAPGPSHLFAIPAIATSVAEKCTADQVSLNALSAEPKHGSEVQANATNTQRAVRSVILAWTRRVGGGFVPLFYGVHTRVPQRRGRCGRGAVSPMLRESSPVLLIQLVLLRLCLPVRARSQQQSTIEHRCSDSTELGRWASGRTET